MEAEQGDANSESSSSNIKNVEEIPLPDDGRNSPPPNCAICLGTCRNKSFTDSCFHQFCFRCLLTWSKVKAECPLCKHNFKAIIHNVKSNSQYEEYMVDQQEDEGEREDVSTNTRFRYRTTLTLPRSESIAIQELLMRYPLMADVMPPSYRRRSLSTMRRTVYRYNLWARPLPDFTGRFRDCSPEFYRSNTSQIHRLVPWLNRELQYLLNENVGHISYVISRILELLPQYHINSSEFRNVMQRYFGERTVHFLHELYSFASTPYDMTGYDRSVQYTTERVSGLINEVLSSSDPEASVDSDIMVVSSSEPTTAAPSAAAAPAAPPAPPAALAGSSRVGPAVPPPAYPRHYIPEPPPTQNVIPIETISHYDTDDSSSSEVMVVGYIKPPRNRTPEVVDLLESDSDVILQDAEETAQPLTAASSPSAQAAVAVKLTLRRHDPRASSTSSSSAYTPPTRASRKRRRSSSRASTASFISSILYNVSSDSDWDSDAYRFQQRKNRRVQTHTAKNKRKQPAPRRSLGIRKKNKGNDQKRKGSAKVGEEQPGPSGERERRMRSVVNVMPTRSTQQPRASRSPGRASLSPGNESFGPCSASLSPGNESFGPCSASLSPGRAPLSPGRASLSPGRASFSLGSDSVSLGSAILSTGNATISPDSASISPVRASLSLGSDSISLGSAILSTGSATIGPGSASISPVRASISPVRASPSRGSVSDPEDDLPLNLTVAGFSSL